MPAFYARIRRWPLGLARSAQSTWLFQFDPDEYRPLASHLRYPLEISYFRRGGLSGDDSPQHREQFEHPQAVALPFPFGTLSRPLPTSADFGNGMGAAGPVRLSLRLRVQPPYRWRREPTVVRLSHARRALQASIAVEECHFRRRKSLATPRCRASQPSEGTEAREQQRALSNRRHRKKVCACGRGEAQVHNGIRRWQDQ